MKKQKQGISAKPANRLHYKICFLSGLVSLIIIAANARAQVVSDSVAIKNLLDKVETRQKALTPEKLYVSFDKPNYAVGDTAWLKAYVLMDNKASVNSAKLYVELLNNTGKLVQRLTLPIANGLATGYFPLDAKTITEDDYTIRAYTNWQQNFGAGSFFYRQFSVGKLAGKTWLVTEQNRHDNPADTNHVQVAMRFTDARGLPLVTRPVTVRILENNKPILKSDLTTGVDGTLNGGITLPAKANHRNLSIVVEDAKDKSQRIAFPFYPAGAGGDIDMQFMPEGGNLVAGLYNKIGFKAIGQDGLGRDVTGTIIDSKGEEAATLQSLHNGMGSFVLVPQAGETYTVKIWVNGKERKYALPTAKAQGITLRVDGITHDSELYVYISSSIHDDKRYTLIAQSGDKVYFGSPFRFNADNYFNTRIKETLFPTGIINLLVLGPDNKPVGQRSVFVDRYDALKITTMPSQAAYAPKDSITLNLHVTGRYDEPVQANFSIAVTDDAQIKDASRPDNIQSHFLLTSELKGHIENPAWYFEHGTDEENKLKQKALDNLLLTQGWQGFDWDRMDTAIPQPKFKPEPDISVSGNLVNLVGKPAGGIKVTLLSNGKQPVIMDTLSAVDGKFHFGNLPVVDSVAYLVKLHNKRDKSAAAEIRIDEFTPTEAPLAGLTRPMPWNMNTDTTLINYINRANQRSQVADVFVPPANTKLLKQVDIKAARIIKYVGGDFGAELIKIDEEQLVKAKKMSLMELIYQKIPGFHISSLYSPSVYGKGAIMHHQDQFVVNNLLVNDIIADGQSVANPFAIPQDVTVRPGGVNSAVDLKPGEQNLTTDPSTKEVYDRLKDFLTILGADDVKNISLYRGTQLYLDIETRSGKGPFVGVSRGTYAYHPPVMQLPRQFYSPKYTVKNTLPDYRSTIHWEPNVVTDTAGNAKVSFYAAGAPSTYTIIVEGTDMQGHFGVDIRKLKISQGTAELKK